VLVEIAPHIFLLPGENNGLFPFSHSILVRDEVTALIDTGCGLGRLEWLKEHHPPDLVINSHAHLDHIAGNWLFPRLPLLAPRQSFDYTGRIDMLSERFTESKELARQWREYVRQEMGFRDALPTGHYDDGHRFDFGSMELLALFCPGHTCDSYCFLEPTRGIAFTFDMDLSPFGPWYGHSYSEIDDFEASLERVRALKPRMIVSSHMGIVTEDIDARLVAYGNVIAQRDRRILDFLSEERTLEEMIQAPLIYNSYAYAPDLLRRWEENMLRKHLRRLLKRGLVKATEKAYVTTAKPAA
jgi:ribonuclease/clavin/mitogillin